MICNCPKCRTKITANRNDMAKLKYSFFVCPNCQTKIKILPSKGKCGKCEFVFGYYDFLFPKKDAYARCPKCKVKNRLKIKY